MVTNVDEFLSSSADMIGSSMQSIPMPVRLFLCDTFNWKAKMSRLKISKLVSMSANHVWYRNRQYKPYHISIIDNISNIRPIL